MTLSAADIAYMSPYSVSDTTGSKFTTAEFNYQSAKAKARLDREDPGLEEADYDHAHALLVCHLHELKLGTARLKSESLGDYSYSKAGDDGSTFLMEYKELLKVGGGRSAPQTQAKRCDADMDDFDLDQGTIPSFGEE